MSILPIACIAILVAGIGTAHQTLSNGSGRRRDAEQAVRESSRREVEAFLNNDLNALARLWSDDLIVTNPLNNLVHKQDVLALIRSGFLKITSYDRRLEYARVYGELVIVAGRESVVWGGRMPNAGHVEQLRFTAVWRKQGGRWQQVARHANIVGNSASSGQQRSEERGEPQS